MSKLVGDRYANLFVGAAFVLEPLFFVIFVTAAQAASSWECSNDRFKLKIEERKTDLLMHGGETAESWTISVSNGAALIATEPVIEWSRVTKRQYPDKESVEKDTHPTGATLSIFSLDKISGAFQLASYDIRRGLILHEKGMCVVSQ